MDNNSELLKAFLNGITANDADAAKTAFSAYCNNKAKIMTNRRSVMEKVENFKTQLVEYGLSSVNGAKSGPDPVRLDGDKIFVNGKMVGRIDYDMDDWGGGINFISDDNTFSKEFNTAEELFSFISKKFLGEGKTNE